VEEAETIVVIGKGFPMKGSELRDAIDSSRRLKSRYIRIWDMCNLFLQGKQHLKYDSYNKSFAGERRRPGRQRVTINMILNIYRNMLARLAMAYPSITVLPSSDSVEDIVKAQSCETALKWYWHSEAMNETLGDLVSHLLVTGNAGVHTYYDSEVEKIRTKIINPYDMFFEPGANSFEESRFIAIRHLVHKKDLARSYPEYAEFIMKQPDADLSAHNSMYATVTGTQNYSLKERIELFEVYHVDGMVCQLVGTKKLYTGTWPGKILPVQFVNYTKMPNRLWGTGMIEPLLELQSLYNRGRAQIVENAELMGNPKWLIPKGAGLSKNALSSSRPGEKVMYNANTGPAPTQISAAPIPAYVVDNIKQINAEMMDIAGVHSTSLGKRAIGIESGAAIEALSSKDAQQLQVTQDNIERGVKDLAEVVLTYMRKFYPEEKMMRIMDETGRIVFHQLRQTDINEGADVYLEAGSLFRDEKQDRDKRIMELLQAGLIEKDQALQELHFKTGNAFITKKMRALSHAQDMLEAVLRGAFIEIMPTDDLKAFEKTFGDFMQTRTFYDLEPERQEYVRDVLIAVTTFGMEQQEQAEQMMKRTVFPQQAPQEQEAKQLVASAGSPNTQQQIASAHDDIIARKRIADGEPNPEAGLTRIRQGGTG
tara:strand:- start:19718 stop:21673 length:1956 start_codon:yes stop_codon:yes gene_type:complete